MHKYVQTYILHELFYGWDNSSLRNYCTRLNYEKFDFKIVYFDGIHNYIR